MSDDFVDEDGVPIQMSLDKSSYAKLPPAKPATYAPDEDPPAHPFQLEAAPAPSIAERIETLFAKHGPSNVHAHDSLAKFAFLPSADQTAILREARDDEFGVYLQRAKPMARRQAIEARGHQRRS